MPESHIDGADRDLTMAGRIGKATMEALDHLESEYPGCELETVLVAFAVRLPGGFLPPDADEEDEPVPEGAGVSTISYYCEDPRRWVQRAVLREALETAE